MKTVLLRFAVRRLWPPAPRPVSRAGEWRDRGPAPAAGGRPSLPDRVPTSGLRRRAEPVAAPTPRGGSLRLAFLPSAVQLWTLDLASRWRGGDKRTWGQGQDTGGEKGQRGFPAGTAGAGGRSGKGGSWLRCIQRPPSPGPPPNLQPPASDAPRSPLPSPPPQESLRVSSPAVV